MQILIKEIGLTNSSFQCNGHKCKVVNAVIWMMGLFLKSRKILIFNAD